MAEPDIAVSAAAENVRRLRQSIGRVPAWAHAVQIGLGQDVALVGARGQTGVPAGPLPLVSLDDVEASAASALDSRKAESVSLTALRGHRTGEWQSRKSGRIQTVAVQVGHTSG